jgi:sulfatase maturation enzyme AslB (radical SAM superfamily)
MLSNGSVAQFNSANDLTVLMNTPAMKKIRTEMLSGNKPAACQRCYHLEDHQMVSHRQGSNQMFPFDEQQLKKETKPDGAIDVELLSVDLRLGNVCNLKCRMCSPYSSKLLIPEFIKMYPEKKYQYQQLQKLDWFTNQNFIELFKKHSTILKLHFAGGEPLVIKEHSEILQKIIDAGYADKVTITYNTNFTTVPEHLKSLWTQFEGISLMVSLDGYDLVNEYIRQGAKWSMIHENIQWAEQNTEKINFINLFFNTTVQVYNIFSLADFFKFIIQSTQKFSLPILSPVFFPEEFSIQILPENLKSLAEERLIQFLNSDLFANSRFSDSEKKIFISSIKGLIRHMKNDDKSDLIPQFIKKTDFFDNERSQSILNIVPELTSLWS